jgi:hypothetical protein
MIFNYFVCFSLGCLLGDFVFRMLPNECNMIADYLINTFVNVSYNIVYYYSKCEIFFNKYIKKQSQVIYLGGFRVLSPEDVANKLTSVYVKGDPNFVITSDNSVKPISKRITYGEKEPADLVFEPSDIKFMLVEFTIDGNSYKIDLKTDNYNYYMIGNKFTKEFFIYFLFDHMKINYNPKHPLKCGLKIIDHDVNKIELDFTDKNEYIILEKNGYKLNITNHSE